jgi:ATP-dependent RNA helicase RhlE
VAYPKDNTNLTTFKDLGLARPLLAALANEGYVTPTPIQAMAIPALLEGKDLLGIAQTGSGKTAAFALPILHRLAADRKAAPRRGCRTLVLSPTRELATQIADSFRTYGAGMGLTVAVVFGGVKYGPQVRALAGGIDILVATPGRLIDHMQEKVADLSAVETFVLDEADQMLDMGFLQPIKRIASALPKTRQTLFFSATMPTEIAKLAEAFLRNPTRVQATPAATPVERIDQSVIFVEGARKSPLLAELLADAAMSRSLIFTRTKRGADKVAKYLGLAGVEAAAIHGDKTQGQRERALAAFKAGEVRALVATDIAARGIDVDAVSHVVNYDLPYVPEAYAPRIGRTARGGADGVAISLVADDERPLLKDIQKLTRQTIPAFDRRNDRALGAAAAADRKIAPEAGERVERSHHRPEPARAGGRHKGHDPRREAVAKPQGGGPRRPNRRRSRSGGGQSRASA